MYFKYILMYAVNIECIRQQTWKKAIMRMNLVEVTGHLERQEKQHKYW